MTGDRLFGGEGDLAASRARRSRETLGQFFGLFEHRGVERRVQKRVELFGLDLEQGFLLGDHALADEVAGDLDRCPCGTLAVAGLQHIEFALFDGELHVLHVAVGLLEPVCDLDKLLVDLGVGLFEVIDGHRGADAGNDVLALSVHQILAEQSLLAGRGVAGERNAGARSVAHVAEHHRLHVDGGAPAGGDVVHAAIDDRAGVVPAAEDSLDRLDQLHLGILREVLTLILFVELLELGNELLQIFRSELGVHLDALLLFEFVDDLLKRRLGRAHDDVGEHLDESAVAVIGKARIAGLACKPLDRHVVETEIEDGVHHAGHRGACARTDGDEEGVLFVAELLAGILLHLCERVEDLFDDLARDGLAVIVIFRACLGGDGKAFGNGHAPRSHLGEVSAFAAELRLVVAVCLFEKIDVFCHNKPPENLTVAYYVFILQDRDMFWQAKCPKNDVNFKTHYICAHISAQTRPLPPVRQVKAR